MAFILTRIWKSFRFHIENNNSPKAHQLIYNWHYIENIHKEIRKIFLQYIEQKLNNDDITKALKQNISSENISKLKDAHSQIKQFAHEMKKIKLKIIEINKLHKLIKKLNLTYLDKQYIDISDFIKSIKLNNTPYDIERTLARKILPIILKKLDGNPNKLEGEPILKIISVAK